MKEEKWRYRVRGRDADEAGERVNSEAMEKKRNKNKYRMTIITVIDRICCYANEFDIFH